MQKENQTLIIIDVLCAVDFCLDLKVSGYIQLFIHLENSRNEVIKYIGWEGYPPTLVPQ